MFDYWSRKFWDGQRSLELLINQQATLTDYERESLFRSNVEVVNLELSKHCNRKCNYCPVSNSSRQSEQEIMDDSLFFSVAASLKKIGYAGTISLNLYNEPLLNPKLEEQIAHLRQSVPKAYISFNSNGDSLKLDRLTSLANAGLNYVCVTLHPKPDTVISEKEVFRRTKQLLKKLDIHSIDESELSALVKTTTQLEVRTHGVTVRIQWPDWNVLGGSRGGEIAVLDIGKPVRRTPCVRPFREFTMYYDGTVTPCCEVFHDETTSQLAMGQVKANETQTIFAVYTSTYLSEFRRSVFDYSEKWGVCKHCPVVDYANGEDTSIRSAIMKDSIPTPNLKVVPKS